jgi:RNA 2',3'-cyclic 3'-phosphodiesterase
MRAFIAIELPENIHQTLAREQARFRRACPDARWTRPEGLHLTLKFLGEIAESKTGEVIHSLEGMEGFRPFSLEVRGFGFFPNARRPRIFWAGVTPTPPLSHLAEGVESAMQSLGFPLETRTFSPHLTLGRFKSLRPQPKLEALLRGSEAAAFGTFEVREFYLWESRLSPGGSEYRKVAEIAALSQKH